jgi:2-polyprenyl-3-methyl-5-hydroxy-6-metoxy-1,4-benzoquinol methylase
VYAVRIRSALNRIRRFTARQGRNFYPVTEWDREYASAAWKYLDSLEQVPRYSVIEGWRRQLKPKGSVLDLGCGEGVLFEHISSANGVDYTGVDFSQVAIDAAVAKIRNHAVERFVCADVVSFDPAAGFDVIVFNEILYYLADPIAVVRRYQEFLAADGIVIVSIFHANLRTWKAINALLRNDCLQTIFVEDVSSGKRWYLGLYQNVLRSSHLKRKG